MRHTPPDGLVTATASAKGDTVTITVTDECGGIPEGDLERLFEPGWRGSEARTPGEGAGLGLAVVQEVVAAHRGSVNVVNTDVGCAFTMTLPRT
jgi:signal transduction histidine kinase